MNDILFYFRMQIKFYVMLMNVILWTVSENK